MTHTPVLLKETIESLEIKSEGLYIDCTLGEGGHTQAILDKGGKVLAIDADSMQIANNQLRIKNKEVKFVQGNFKDIEQIAKDNNFFPVDGVLFDLGLSMIQLAESGKGLSYRKHDEALDMRLDENREYTAADVVNDLPAEDLYDIFAKYAEELHSREIADGIVQSRVQHKIHTVGDLIKVLDKVISRCPQKHDHDNEKIYARIFQALRIIVNGEINNLKKGLEGAKNILKQDGRICVISFHSVEDRVIKLFVREKKLKSYKEYKGQRSFERSARLRVFGL
jgi:16S rRNA (cytosine1402-N4)-methyltransferase